MSRLGFDRDRSTPRFVYLPRDLDSLAETVNEVSLVLINIFKELWDRHDLYKWKRDDFIWGNFFADMFCWAEGAVRAKDGLITKLIGPVTVYPLNQTLRHLAQ